MLNINIIDAWKDIFDPINGCDGDSQKSITLLPFTIDYDEKDIPISITVNKNDEYPIHILKQYW